MAIIKYGQSITGNWSEEFYICYEDRCFPEENWTDLTTSVLAMWSNSLLQNRWNDQMDFPLYFMDGPFMLNVHKHEDDLTIDFVNARGIQKVTEFTILCRYYDFMEAMYNALKRFSYLLYTNKLHHDFESAYNQTLISIREIKEIL